MSNRHNLNQFQYTFEKDTVTIFGQFKVGASGAVTAGSVKGGGVSGVVKESAAGQYSIKFKDKYSRLLDFGAQVIDDAVSDIVKCQILENPDSIQSDVKSDGVLTIQFAGIGTAPALAAANPADGALVMFRAVFRNTTVDPFYR